MPAASCPPARRLRIVASAAAARVVVHESPDARREPPPPSEEFLRGRAEAERACRPELERLQAENRRLAAELPAAAAQAVRELEARMCEEACELALRLTRFFVERVASREELLRSALREALAPVARETAATVHVHPDDARLLKDGAAHPPGVAIVEAPHLRPGDLEVHAPQGVIEASLDGRLAALAQALRDRLRESGLNHDQPASSPT